MSLRESWQKMTNAIDNAQGWILDFDHDFPTLDMAVVRADTEDGLVKTHLLIDSDTGIKVMRRNENQVALILEGHGARRTLLDILNGRHPTEETCFTSAKPDD